MIGKLAHRALTFGAALSCLIGLAARADTPPAAAPAYGEPHGADYVIHDFHFRSGESLPELRIHYTTFGTPHRDASGRIDNAVLILHGTGGAGTSLIRPQFAGELFGPGQLLDNSKYFIILPDGIGHGKSSKPSDGLHMRFPHYGYSRHGRGAAPSGDRGPGHKPASPAHGHLDGLHAGLHVGRDSGPMQWSRSCRWPACRSASSAATGSGGG